jgi:sugar (pentulose or hexulose) kinase
LSLKTSPVDIVRACMEAIAVRLSTINEALRADGMADRDAMLVASGGALEQSPVWCQMIADACGAPLVLADTSEATSAGVARVAAWRFAETRSTAATGRAFVPNPRYTAVYRAARERLNALYAQVVSDAH